MSHILEGSSGGTGGLIIRKKNDDSVFKVPDAPKRSLLGLDKLSELRKKVLKDEKKKSKDNSSSSDSSDSNSDEDRDQKKSIHREREYRSKYSETPTYSGGVDRYAREKLHKKESKHKDKYYVQASSKKYKDRHRSHDYEDRHRRHHGDRRRYDDRYDRRSQRDDYSARKRFKSERNSERSSRRDPRFSEAPETPKMRVKDGTDVSNWDDDERPRKKSEWDMDTPYRESRQGDWSHRSSRRMDTFPTVNYLKNQWEKEDLTEEELAKYEEEEKRLDRQW